MTLARHLQHVRIENDTSRQAGQVRWPQSTHLTLKRGHSIRLLIGESGYFQLHRVIQVSFRDSTLICSWISRLLKRFFSVKDSIKVTL
jgi:hypothetical protein